MDALALLCTLHADGPKTARRLRQAGITGLAGLRTVPLATLADVLQGDLSVAERFLREAEFLELRTGEGVLEDEATESPRRAASTEPATLMRVPEPTPAAPEPESGGEHVLQRYVINPLIRPAKDRLRVSRVPATSEGHRLRSGLLSGLDHEACQRLEAGGVRTAEDLAKASGLDLALELGWPYDRVFHLKKEASHFVRKQRAETEAEHATF